MIEGVLNPAILLCENHWEVSTLYAKCGIQIHSEFISFKTSQFKD